MKNQRVIQILKDKRQEPGLDIDTQMDIEEAISQLDNPGPVKIKRAEYTDEIDPKTDYCKLHLTFEDGTKRDFCYHKSNPMPSVNTCIGLTWDELVNTVKGMFYLAAGDFHVTEQVEPYIKPDNYHITLPIPIGGTAWQYSLDCENQCLEREKFSDEERSSLGCFTDAKCHTRLHGVTPVTIDWNNIGLLLKEYGKTMFATEAGAYRKAEQVIQEHKKYWEENRFQTHLILIEQ